MKLQELITKHDLGLTYPQVKAFFLGILSADRPMSFDKAYDELLEGEAQDLKPEFKKFWDELQSKRGQELKALFSQGLDLGTIKEQLDYFLTSLSLSGTNAETVKDEDLAEILEELEDLVMDLDDVMAEGTPEEGEEIKEVLMEVWKDFVLTRQ